MLISIRFKNIFSFFEENTLSMHATADKEFQDLNTFTVDESLFHKREKNELLKFSIIFGANASGKTNVIKVLIYIYNAIKLSQATNIIADNPIFEFYTYSQQINSEYEIEFIWKNIRYRYGFNILQGQVIKEWLFKKIEKEVLVFERVDNELKISNNKRHSTSLINIQPSTLFLTIGTSFKLSIVEDLQNVLEWINTNIVVILENNANRFNIYDAENKKYHKQAIKILKKADIGVEDFCVTKNKVLDRGTQNQIADIIRFNTAWQANQVGQIQQENEVMYDIDIQTKFAVYDENKKKVGTRDIMLLKSGLFHSEGTKRLFHYLGFILAAIDKGQVIIVDEIDSKLHFLLAVYLIRMFNSIDKNSNNAQLICTAHNLMLMDEDLRRDQIYFVSKDMYGESNLCSLADIKGVRKNDLLSKRYLAGFYSQLPDMNRKV